MDLAPIVSSAILASKRAEINELETERVRLHASTDMQSETWDMEEQELQMIQDCWSHTEYTPALRAQQTLELEEQQCIVDAAVERVNETWGLIHFNSTARIEKEKELEALLELRDIPIRILDLPLEILTLIVCEAVFEAGGNVHTRRRQRDSISCVSTSLHSLVDDTASLWTELIVTYPIPTLDIHLQRSKGAPLHLIFHFEETLHDVAERLQMLIAHVHRWGKVRLSGWDEGIPAIRETLAALARLEAPMLSKLTMHIELGLSSSLCLGSVDFPLVFGGGTPRLRHVDVDQFAVLPPLSTVTSATIELEALWPLQEGSHAYRTLINLSMIRSLVLNVASIDVPILPPTIVLANLESLEISCANSGDSDYPHLSRVFRLFDTPRLKRLRLASFTNENLTYICETLGRRFPLLHTLELDLSYATAAFPLGLVEASPKLESLTLVLSGRYQEVLVTEHQPFSFTMKLDVPGSLDELLEAVCFLGDTLSKGKDTPWPQLSALQIESRYASKDAEKTAGLEEKESEILDKLRGLVDSRRATDCPIRELKLSTLVNVSLHERVWFHGNAEHFSV